jgi:hypothetical protein
MTTTTVSKMFQADHRKRHGWFWYVSTCNDRPLQRTRFDSAADSDRHCSRQQRNTNRWWPSGMGAFAGTGEAEPSSEARTCDRQHAAGWTGDGGLNPKLDAEESQDHRVDRLQAAPQHVAEVVVPVEHTLAGWKSLPSGCVCLSLSGRHGKSGPPTYAHVALQARCSMRKFRCRCGRCKRNETAG